MLNIRYVLLAAVAIVTFSIFAFHPPQLHHVSANVGHYFPKFGTGSVTPGFEDESSGSQSASTTESDGSKEYPDESTWGAKASNEPSKYAFVTYLQENTAHNADTESDMDDEYFVAVRVLGYQVMHSPRSGTNTSIPFVCVVTKEVTQRKRDRLARDGAQIIEVEDVELPPWIAKKIGDIDARWRQVMTKLRVFQLTQFEKILLFDGDIFVVDRMDGIFHDPATDTSESDTLKESVTSKTKDLTAPPAYMFAGQAQQGGWNHPYPPNKNDDYFGAGFFAAHPSQEIYDYYLEVLKIEHSFDPVFPEQNLLNHAHRRNGPMPWTEVNYTWTTTYPTYSNYQKGAKSLHHKFWWESTNTPDNGLNKLTVMWYESKGEAMGYYKARDEAEAKSGY